MNFLSNVLREDGGFEYKKVIVDSILILIREIPEAKEPGLGHLCEFIEVKALLTIISCDLSQTVNSLQCAVVITGPSSILKLCAKHS